MSLKPLHSALAGIGAWMLGACLSALETLYPQRFSPHPIVILTFGIGGAALIVIASVLWLRAYSAEKNKPAVVAAAPPPRFSQGSGNQAGHDNFGKQIANVEHYHEANTPALVPAAPKPILSPTTFIIAPRFAYIAYDESPGCWKVCSPGHPASKEAIVADVLRNVPPQGEKAEGTIAAIAILRFTTVGLEQIPRAYWLNRRDSVTIFEVGHKECLVIGTIEQPFFASYTNPKHGDLMEDGYQIPYRQLGPRTVMTPVSLTFEVSLFDCYSERTVQQNKFRADFGAHTVSVKVIS